MKKDAKTDPFDSEIQEIEKREKLPVILNVHGGAWVYGAVVSDAAGLFAQAVDFCCKIKPGCLSKICKMIYSVRWSAVFTKERFCAF